MNTSINYRLSGMDSKDYTKLPRVLPQTIDESYFRKELIRAIRH